MVALLVGGGCEGPAATVSGAPPLGEDDPGPGTAEPTSEPGTGPTGAEPLDVPEPADVVEASGSCVAMDGDEVLLSVSPEGHAWLGRLGSEAQVLRVIDPFEDMSDATVELALPEISAAVAWSGTDATLATADGLWRLEHFERIAVDTPTELSPQSAICGDPGRDGLLLEDGVLWERRFDGRWWRWESGGAAVGFVGHEQACAGVDEVLWMTTADGTLLRLAQGRVDRPVRFTGLRAAAATDGVLAVLDEDFLWTASDPDQWQPWRFTKAMPTMLSASGGAVWMVAGKRILRFTSEGWAEIEADLDGRAWTAVAAHAHGAWALADGELCNLGLGSAIRVEGLRPFWSAHEAEHEVVVEASDGSEVRAWIGGEPLTLAQDEESGRFEGTIELATVGWHRVKLEAGAARRDLAVRRLPGLEVGWEADVRPLAEVNCSGQGCHDANALKLDSLEAWEDNASKIEQRVLEAMTMPPPGTRDETWGEAQLELVEAWFEGGMLP